MAFTYVYLKVGEGYRVATGGNTSAQIRATPLVEMTNGPTIVDSAVTLPLGSDGVATRTVAATTDPATTPSGSAYTLEVIVGQRTIHRLTAAIPHDAGSVVDLSSLVVLNAPPALRPGTFRVRDALDFSDVAATLGQFPQWDGSQWVPASIAVDLTGAQPLSVLLTRLAAAPVTVDYAASVTLNAATSCVHRVVATADLTLADITGGAAGQQIIFIVKASGADCTVSFPAGGPDPVTVTSGQRWPARFVYDQPDDAWIPLWS